MGGVETNKAPIKGLFSFNTKVNGNKGLRVFGYTDVIGNSLHAAPTTS